MEVQLQEKGENTCVACAACNALGHFGIRVPLAELIEAMHIRRFGPAGGSFIHRAAKYLAAYHGMQIVASRPPYQVLDHFAAADEAARRWAAQLDQGYVGLLRRKETKRMGHAVILYQVRQVDGVWLLDTYDSAAHRSAGWATYRAIDYVWWLPENLTMSQWLQIEQAQREHAPRPTGRTAWFVRPRRRADGHPGG